MFLTFYCISRPLKDLVNRCNFCCFINHNYVCRSTFSYLIIITVIGICWHRKHSDTWLVRTVIVPEGVGVVMGILALFLLAWPGNNSQLSQLPNGASLKQYYLRACALTSFEHDSGAKAPQSATE